MSTYINVTVGKAGLSDKAKQQTNANRQAKLEADARDKAEVDGKRQRDANRALQGIGPDGKSLFGQPLQTAVRKDEPAAWRRTLGDFGFIDVRGCNTGESADNYFKEKYQISTQRTISKCKVVRVVIGGAADACVGWDADPLEFFDGKTEQLAQFINLGGIVWINNEYSDCGIDPASLNQYIYNAFGASVAFVYDTQPEGTRGYFGPFAGYGVVKSQLAYAAQSGLAPPFFYNAFTCSISGGTPYYANEHGVVCAFEKIGKGFLVLSGDQNGTGQFPSYTEGDKNFIDALLALK